MNKFDKMLNDALFKRGYDYAKNELSSGTCSVESLEIRVGCHGDYKTHFDQGVEEAVRQHKEVV